MTTQELIRKLRQLHHDATIDISDVDSQIRAQNKDVENLDVPFILYDYTAIERDCNGLLLRGKVVPVKVTRFGWLLNCSFPTIDILDHNHRRAVATVDMFYLTADNARKALEHELALANRQRARDELQLKINQYFPQLLEAAEEKINELLLDL